MPMHDLFLPEKPGEEPVEPVSLSIARIRPWRENFGRTLEPDELPNIEAIRDRWGSGTYYVTARDRRKCVLAGREIVVRGPPPRAMDEEGTIVDESVAAVKNQFAGPTGAPTDNIMGALMAFMQNDQAQRRADQQAFLAAERERNQSF